MAGFDNDIVYAKNADFTQSDNQAPAESNGLVVNGQLWIGATATNAGGTHVNVGTLTSPNGSITFAYNSPNITAQVAGGSTSVLTLTGNSGVATPSGGNINVITANTTVRFVGSGATLTQDFGLGNLVLGSSLPVLTSGTENVGVGNGILGTLTSGTRNVGIGGSALDAITTGTQNIAIGWNAGTALTQGGSNVLIGPVCGSALTTGLNNTAVGQGALNQYTAGAANLGGNCAFGVQALSAVTTGTLNTGVGFNSLAGIQTGLQNTALGNQSGNAHTLADSSNIDIGNFGTLGDSNTIRIGTQGSGAGQQNRTFISGIVGVTTSNSQTVTINSSTGQLGVSTSSIGLWSVVTGTSQAGVAGNGYIANNAGLVTVTLPSTSAVGDIIAVTGINNATGWRVAQNAGNTIFFGTSTTTPGVGGSLSSSATRDSVYLLCVTANAAWNVLNSVGNLTVV